jgi:VWFA-related protein
MQSHIVIRPAKVRRLRHRLLASIFSICILLVPFAYGQATAQSNATQPKIAPPKEDASVPTIVSNVDEVTLDLTVRNKKHKPVLDLKPEDLNITDNGTPVKIADLRLVTGSNTDHMITFFYDQLSSSSATNARNLTDKILKMFPDQNFYFSVLNFERRLRLYQGFTTDRDDLKKAIYSATEVRMPGSKQPDDAALPEKRLLSITSTGADLSGTSVSLSDREKAQVMLQSLQDSQELIPDHNVLPSLTGLLALSRTQRRLKGRKAIVYFVQGYDLKSNAMDTLRAIVSAANRSGVSLYVIDVNAVNQQVDQGLMAQMVLGNLNSSIQQGQQTGMPSKFGASNIGGAVGPPTSTGPGATVGGGVSTAPSAPASGLGTDTQGMAYGERLQFQNVKDGSPLAVLAASTGGTSVLAGENPKKALAEFLEDMTMYYEASYVPPDTAYDGKFRPIRVGSPRKDLRIQTRSGYFAVPPGESSSIRAFEPPLLKILSASDLPSDLKFRAGVLRLGDLPDGNANTLVVEVPAANLEMLEDHNTNLYSLHLSVVAQIKNKDGVVIDHFSQDFPQRGSLDTKDDMRAGVITMQKHFMAVPGKYTLEVAVLDQNSDKAGAERTNFEIQSSTDGPSLSDMTVVRKTVPFNTDTDPLEPLRYEETKVVPNLSGDIARDAKNISLYFLVHSDPHGSATPMLEMEVSRNNNPIGRMPMPLRTFSAGGTLPYMASIKAGALPPGHYDVTATLTQGEKTSQQTISFEIPGAEMASAAVPNSATPANLVNSNDPELAAYAKFSPPEIGSQKIPHLEITPAITVTARLSNEDAAAMIMKAKNHALTYSTSLPNFTCIQITDRSLDASGKGQWKHRDSIAELLRFVDGKENRKTLEINGQRNDTSRDDMDQDAALSHGEFGNMLNAIFKSESKTEFQWKETDTLNGAPVQVFNYHVAKENSSFSLGGVDNQELTVGFHGTVYFDASTLGVRRITLEADDIPRKFSIHSTSITIDYDYFSINGHDYLMPISETVGLTRGKRQADMNEIEFRDYKRYGAKTKITYGAPTKP